MREPVGITPSVFARAGKTVRRRDGNVAQIFALLLTGVVAASGAAVDFSSVYGARSKMQAALDVAVIVAAKDDTGSWLTTAQDAYKAQLSAEVAALAVPTFTKSVDKVVSATVNASVPLAFGPFVGKAHVDVAVKSEAAVQTTAQQSAVCILALANTNQAFLANGGSKLTAPDCGVDVKSTSNPAAIFNSNTNYAVKEFCIQGSNIINNGGTVSNLKTGCTTISDPFQGQLPAPPSLTCEADKQNKNYDSGAITLSPGVYCGWTNFNGGVTSVTFQPGVYVIKNGGWNVNGGKWTGNGVTFYFADTSKIQFNSQVQANLKAPTSGTYDDILIYEPNGLSSSDFILNPTSGHVFSGLIYLPSRNLYINGGANVTANAVSMVVRTVIFNTAGWTMEPAVKKRLGKGESPAANGSGSMVYLKK